MTGRRFKGRIIEFGEQIWAKLAKPKQRGKHRRKLAARWTAATWVGAVQRTGEHRVVTRAGRAIRVRTIKRVPIETRWNRDIVLGMEARPRKPNPADLDQVDVEPLREDDVHQEAAPPQDHGAGGADDGPEVQPPPAPREFRLTKRILDKYHRTV